ncbi:MAG: PEP-CTERM sorting domain-containing protein [Rubrivivax sp.]
MQTRYLWILASAFAAQLAQAALLTDANDSRNWQGATVGTFATLYYGSNTPANRQLAIDNKLLDDSIFDATGYVPSALVTSIGQYSNQGGGTSTDLTGTGGYAYTCCGTAASRFTAANAIDNQWMQTSGVVGETVWDLGFQASKAAVFNTIDHGPLPQEAIESTVYLSNDQTTWTAAVVERVWLEGFMPNTNIVWDGFAYAVGTGTVNTFRYASIIHGGPGALISDGDNEINGILGTRADFTPPIPEPGSSALMLLGLAGLFGFARLRRQA